MGNQRKIIELSRDTLFLGNVQVEVGEYAYARIGKYISYEIEERTKQRISAQLHKEKLFVTDEMSEEEREEITKKYWKRKEELGSEFQSDEYTKFMTIVYGYGSNLNFEDLENNIEKSVSEGIKDLIALRFLSGSNILPHQALLASHESHTRLEIMATEDIELRMRF